MNLFIEFKNITATNEAMVSYIGDLFDRFPAVAKQLIEDRMKRPAYLDAIPNQFRVNMWFKFTDDDLRHIHTCMTTSAPNPNTWGGSRKVEAIKYARSVADYGLKDAKDFCEWLEVHSNYRSLGL